MLTSDKCHPNKGMPYNLYNDILGKFILGIQSEDRLEGLVGYSAMRTLSIFPKITMNQFTVVDAVMRGQEDIVMNILSANPSCLLQDAIVENSVGVKSERTPLQAAIMANDIQMAQKMQEHFARLSTDLNDDPIDDLDEMHRQIKAIFTESLNRYLDIQLKVLKVLKEQEEKKQKAQTKQYKEIEEKIKQATKRIATYEAALKSDDIHKIIEAHNQAQEHNVFDFQPYVDAILNATPAKLDDAINFVGAGFTETK